MATTPVAEQKIYIGERKNFPPPRRGSADSETLKTMEVFTLTKTAEKQVKRTDSKNRNLKQEENSSPSSSSSDYFENQERSAHPKINVPKNAEAIALLPQLSQERKKINTVLKENNRLIRDLVKKNLNNPTLSEEDATNLKTFVSQQAQVLNSVLELHKLAVHQPESPKRGLFSSSKREERLDFFPQSNSSDPLFERKKQISDFLSKHLVINFEENELFSKKNRKIFMGFIENAKQLLQAIENQKKDPIEYQKSKLLLLHAYRFAVFSFFDQLMTISEHDNKYQKELAAGLGQQLKDDKDNVFFESLRETINGYYFSILDQKIFDLSESLLEKTEAANNKNYFYPKLQEALAKNFDKMEIDDPVTEWNRYLYAGLVVMEDENKQEILGGLRTGEEKDKEKLNEMVGSHLLKMMRIVSESAFNDADLLMDFSLLVVDLFKLREFQTNVTIITKSGCELLDMHARNFAALTQLLKKPEHKRSFLQKLGKGLAEKKPETMKRIQTLSEATEKGKSAGEIMIDYLFKFYRAATQTFVWGPSGVLIDCCHQIFDQAIVKSLTDWEDEKTKQILVRFYPAYIEYNFLRRAYIEGETDHVLLQVLSYQLPKIGIPKFDDPVRIQFYFESIKDKTTQIPSLDEKMSENMRRIAFILEVLKFPRAQRARERALSIP